ncbi:MAG: hypothetical protein ABI651_10210 [Verrucomicrobiota bacterium]
MAILSPASFHLAGIFVFSVVECSIAVTMPRRSTERRSHVIDLKKPLHKPGSTVTEWFQTVRALGTISDQPKVERRRNLCLSRIAPDEQIGADETEDPLATQTAIN